MTLLGANDPTLPTPIARRPERRLGFEMLLSAMGRTLGRPEGEPNLRDAFEAVLRQMLPVRAVHLRRAPVGPRRSHSESGPDSIVFEVPAPHAQARSLLEATFLPGTAWSEWDMQALRTAAQLGGLILELERSRQQLARTTSAGVGRLRRDGAAPLVGSTPAMHALRSKLERVANTHFTILIEGESGVGKELVARQIHDLSPRRHGPFVAVNCAAIVETLIEAELFGIEDRTATGVRGRRGKFEHADGGTLFLDEISDLSLSAQAKLLRAIQELAVERVGGNGSHRVDVRIVAATNRGLSGLVERRLFRPDLFYRLSGVDVHVPPLRERRGDIIELARCFLERHRTLRPLRLSASAGEALVAYDWPGNVRELERLIERAVALAESDVIELDDLPVNVRGAYAEAILPSLMRNDTMRAWGSRYARLVLDRCQSNKREACRVLDISYHTLISYLRYVDPRQGSGDGTGGIDSELGDGTVDSSAVTGDDPGEVAGEQRLVELARIAETV